MLTRGVLGQSFVISAAHTDEDIELTLEASDAALAVYARAVSPPGRRTASSSAPRSRRPFAGSPNPVVCDAGTRRPGPGATGARDVRGDD